MQVNREQLIGDDSPQKHMIFDDKFDTLNIQEIIIHKEDDCLTAQLNGETSQFGYSLLLTLNSIGISFAEKLGEMLTQIEGIEEEGEYLLRNETSHSIVESNSNRLADFEKFYCVKFP